MPVSAKRIIEAIHSVNKPSFNQQMILKFLVENSTITIKGKKKGVTKNFTNKEIHKINDVFFMLTSLGLLETQGSNFIFSPTYENFATIKIDGRGKGTIELEHGEIKFRKDSIENAHNGDVVEYTIVDVRRDIFYAIVTNIRERKKEIYYARIEKKSNGMIYYRLIDLHGEFYALSKRFENEPEINTLVMIELNGTQLAGHPACTLLRTNVGDDESFDFERVVNKFNLPSAYKEYQKEFFITIFEKERANRKDFRGLTTITIDGEHAKDFDDAISFEIMDDRQRLYVHIADVAAFVKPGDELDREALSRGNSYYLGNKVIPMLPEILSNKMCSLREGEEKLTLTAIIEYDTDLNVLHTEFHKSIIVVDKRLTYKGSESMIGDDSQEIPALLSALNIFSKKLKKNRIANGRLDLDLTDFELLYDEHNRFAKIGISKRLQTHELIEECMLAANEAVARLLRKKDIPALYRVHEPISDENWFKLKNFLSIMGIQLNRSKVSAQALQEIIDNYRSNEGSYLVNLLILKSMMQANYGIDPSGHFGLGFEDYTHFTSPIRRYSDLIVHRVLRKHIENDKPLYSKKQLIPIGEKCSELERIAQKAERELYKIKSCRLMENSIGEKFCATISGVSQFGIYVVLREQPIEGMVPFMLMNDDYYNVDEETYTARGRRTGRTFTLGEILDVELVKADHLTAQIDFKILGSSTTQNKATFKKTRKTRPEKSKVKKKHAFEIFKKKRKR